RKADEIRRAVAGVPGVAAAEVQALPPQQPTVQVEVDLAAAEAAGVKPGDVRRSAATLIEGLPVGALFEDQKVFDVVVVGAPGTAASVSDLRALPIDSPNGGTVGLGDVADVRVAAGETVIEHQDISRYVDVAVTVHGRGVGAVTGDVKDRLRRITFPLEH